jgi:hypothetical protein
VGSISKAPVLELEQEQAQKNLLWEARLGLIAWEPLSSPLAALLPAVSRLRALLCGATAIQLAPRQSNGRRGHSRQWRTNRG